MPSSIIQYFPRGDAKMSENKSTLLWDKLKRRHPHVSLHHVAKSVSLLVFKTQEIVWINDLPFKKDEAFDDVIFIHTNCWDD